MWPHWHYVKWHEHRQQRCLLGQRGCTSGWLGCLCCCCAVNLLHFWCQSAGNSVLFKQHSFLSQWFHQFLQVPVSHPVICWWIKHFLKMHYHFACIIVVSLNIGIYCTPCKMGIVSFKSWKCMCMDRKPTPWVQPEVFYNGVCGGQLARS